MKNTVVIGSQGGEWPYRGPIFGVNAQTGEGDVEVLHRRRQRRYRDRRARHLGRRLLEDVAVAAAGWPAAYDPETDTVWWGTGNPAPLYDWAGDKWKTKGPRPGDNLYTTSVILLDPDTGKLKGFHQELPHDAWDFDPRVG